MAKLNPNVVDDAMEAVANNDDGSGFCVLCGSEAATYCDPDTRKAHCSDCGKNAVYGSEEILVQFA
jgi:hypothetical protein